MSKYIPQHKVAHTNLLQFKSRRHREKRLEKEIEEVKQMIRQKVSGGIFKLMEAGLTASHAHELFRRLAFSVALEIAKAEKEAVDLNGNIEPTNNTIFTEAAEKVMEQHKDTLEKLKD
jgi:hypothetical protein